MVARDPLPLEDISVLAAAFTVNGDSHRFNIGERSYEFHGLPYAGAEIDAILARFPNTTTLRDDDFSQDAIVEKMSEHNVLHLATHAEFLPDSPEDSFILFGNGDRANFIDLKNWNLSNTDIVILSACETGIGGVLGDGSEMLGFGYLMQEAGARVSISSLWNIDDGGTERFMGEFYAALQASGVTRAEALRRAQVALIGSGSAVVESSVGSCELDVCFDDGAVVRSGYSHPYYWAPFVLIGDGL
jgi:CHAT domain-containing protein